MSQPLISDTDHSLEQLCYHRLDIRLFFTQTSNINYFIGSILRNNLLFAAEQIKVEEDKSLLEVINNFPIDESHSLYQELSGGFPKGYSLFYASNALPSVLHKNEIFIFSLCLIGKMSHYYTYFIEAIQKMCNRGIGHPMTPLQLVDICEVHPFHPSRLLADSYGLKADSLQLPICLKDFVDHIPWEKLSKDIDVLFSTPVNLVRSKKKTDTSISFQDKLNGFPSFYQLTRSVLHRLLKLTVLYTDSDTTVLNKESDAQLNEWLQDATLLMLNEANVRRVMLKSTPKQDSGQMVFRGYLGTMRYYGEMKKYLPMLLFMQDLGVGNDVVYGVGQYGIKYHLKKN